MYMQLIIKRMIVEYMKLLVLQQLKCYNFLNL